MTTDLIRQNFRLDRNPFTKDIDDDRLWLPDQRTALLDRLHVGIDNGASAYLVGDPGTGKTCLLRALRKRLHPGHHRITYCHDATLGRRDFYRQICTTLGLKPAATAGSILRALATHVETLAGEQKTRSVFILDEAHLLHEATLEHLHIVLNYQWDRKPLLSILLVGLPELTARIGMHRHRSLLSRIAVREHIDPLTPEQTAEYIRHRLKDAGAKSDIFAPDALALLHQCADGLIRITDILATAALADAARSTNTIVTRDHVAQAARALNQT